MSASSIFILLACAVLSAHSLIDSSGCDSNAVCVKEKKDCKSSKDCLAFLKVQQNASMLTVMLSIKKDDVQWVAIGTNPMNSMMNGTSAVTCIKEPTKNIVRVSAVGHHTRPPYLSISNVTLKSLSYVDNVFECSFTRPKVAVAPLGRWDIKQYVIAAYGKLHNNLPTKHTSYIRSEKMVDLSVMKGTFEFTASDAAAAKAGFFTILVMVGISMLF